jgi:hypothetical protein
MSTDTISFTDEDFQFFLTDISSAEEKHKDNSNIEYEIYSIYKYVLNGLQTIIRIFKLPENYKMVICIDEYVCRYEYNTYFNKNLFVSFHDTLRDLISLLFHFRNNYKYSKVIDCIIDNARFSKLEMRHKLMNKICNNEEFEECCVCLELNSVKTSCNHNVCRQCYIKIEPHEDSDDGEEYIPCPLCRESI